MNMPPLHRGIPGPAPRLARTPDDHHRDPQLPDRSREPEHPSRESPAPPPADSDRGDHHLDPQRESEPDTW